MKTSASRSISFFKYVALFVFGISAVYFASAYTSINTALTNASQYIQKVILTSNGNQNGTTGIALDGTVGNAFFNGKVGIGLSSPIYNLDVYKDTSSDVVKFKNNGGELYYGGPSGHGNGANNLVLKTTSNSNTIQMYGATGGVGLEITQRNNRGGIPSSNSITSRGGLFMGTITGNGSRDAGVHLQTNMVDRLVINNTGDVGIGTDNPTAKLDVNGDAKIIDKLLIGPSPTCGHADYLGFCSNKDSYFAGDFSIMNGMVGIGYDMGDSTGANSLFVANTITAGTTGTTCGSATNCKLHVKGDAYFESDDLSLMGGDMGIGYDVGESSSGGNLYVINNVGIGTTGPTDKLQVAGTFASNGLIARGAGVTASGMYSTAMGYNTHANGIVSVAMGTGTTANGSYSTAMGRMTDANGQDSIALGYDTTAAGNQSIAAGISSYAGGNGSTALGAWTIANGAESLANGRYSVAQGIYSTSLGYYTQAAGDYSIALGEVSHASGSASFAAGKHVIAGVADGSAALGKYNVGLSTSIFEIGIGTGSTTKTNAMTIVEDGKVGIGKNATAPDALLTVEGGIRAIRVTANPCTDTTNYPEGTMFYNNTNNYYCFCDNTTTAKRMQTTDNCF